VVHDLGRGFEILPGAANVELYGNIVYYNGWQGPEIPYGTGIQAASPAKTLLLRDNVVFKNFRNGFEVLGANGAEIRLDGNVVFDNGALSARPQGNLLFAGGRLFLFGNHTFFNPAHQGGSNNIGYDSGCASLEARENHWIHPRGTALELNKCAGRIESNVVTGTVDPTVSARYAKNAYHTELPPGVNVIVRRNLFDPGRAHIIVHNGDRASGVAVDLGQAGVSHGASYEIRNVQDYVGTSTIAGIFDGRPVSLRFAGLTAAALVGEAPVPPALPVREFTVFVVMPGPPSTTTTR
jgi:hypothetical protein